MPQLKTLRENKGLSVKALADKVGVTITSIYRYEQGKRIPTLPIARRIATALGVTVDELIRKAEPTEAEGE